MIKNIITFTVLLIAVSQAMVSAQTYTWEKVPVRTAEMRDDGLALGLSDDEIGGEGFQMPWGIAVDPSDANNIYCVIDVSPPLRSTNAGLTWDYIKNGITSFGGICLSVKPTDSNILLYAGSPMTYDTRFATNHTTGIYRSTNKGDTWTKITSTRFNRENQFKGNFAFAWSGNTVYALQHKVNSGDTTQSILRSTDSGITWAAFSTVNTHASCLNIPYGTTTLYVSSSAGLYRVNPDNGAALIIDSKPSRKIVMHPSNGAIAYSVCNTNTSNNGVWKTSNLNTATPTWTQKTTGIHSMFLTAYQCFDIAISPVNANYMYCNYDYDGFAAPYPKYYSSNGGDSWTAVASAANHDLGGLWRSMQMNEGSAIGKGFIVADTANALTAYSCETFMGGVKRTIDGGVTWRYRSHGILGLSGYGFNASPSNMSQMAFDRTNVDKFSFITGDFGMYHSENFVTGTRTYSSRAKAPKFPAGGTGDQRPYAIARKGNTIVVAVGKSGNNQTLSTSVNQGASWFPNNSGSTTVQWGYSLIEFDSNSENLIYAGFWRGTRANNQQDFTWNTPALARFVHHVWKRAGWDYLYSYVSGDKKVYKSTDKGVSWSAPYTTFTGTGTVSGIVVDPANENQIYLLTYGVAGNSGVHKLTGGVSGTWVRKIAGITPDPDGLFNYKCMEIDPNNGNNIYIGSFRSDSIGKVNPAGVHRTTDAGETWVNITGNLGGFDSWTMKVSPHDSVIYNQNASGTWRLTAASEDVVNPTIAITSPTAQNFYGTTSSTLNIGGNASDAGGLDFVNYTLTGDTTGVGTATGTTAWTITALALNNGTSTLTVKATDLAGNEATDVITLARSVAPQESPVPNLLFPYTDSVITIDGNPNEAIWAESVANDIGRIIDGTKSGTASAKGLWDENYLYITIIGTDTSKNSGGTTTPHNYTSQEVYLDGLNNNGSYGIDDFHFTFGWNLNNYVLEASGKTSGVLLSVGTTASGYIVEVAIPWALVGIQGTNSTNLGIDFQQNFNTTGGAARTGATSMYNYQNTNYLNTNNFGLVVLGTQTVQGGAEQGTSSVTKLTGYIAEWQFNETTGSTTVERIAALNGTIYGTGAVTRSAGRYGNSFEPYPGSSTVIVGSSSVMANIGTGTIVAIIRPTADSGAILDRSTGVGGAGFRRFELSASYALWHYKDFSTTDQNILSANSVLTQNEWQTVARTWIGTGTTGSVQFYVNGNLVSQGATTAGIGSMVDDGGLVTAIANRANGSLPFKGKIDNLAIFNHVLSAQEHLDCAAYIKGTTSTALDITSNSAVLYGSMSVSYGSTTTVACFDYGTEPGVYTGSTTAQNTGRTTVGVSDVIHTISGLPAGTTIYYRLRNDNPAYMATGSEQSFVTLSADATVPTVEIVYPTGLSTMTTQSIIPLLITGAASDNVALSHVVWTNVEIGTSGTCAGNTQWNVQSFPIQEGTNTCKITAWDTSNNQGTATLSIFRNLDSPVIEITDPVHNCYLSDGVPALGTTGTSIAFSGLASDYNGIGTVSVSNSATTTVRTATGTESWSSTERILSTLDDGLVFYAKLDEPNSTNVIKDTSRFGITGTNSGSEGTNTNATYGRCRYFDGVDDIINVGSCTQFNPLNASGWSVTAIVYPTASYSSSNGEILDARSGVNSGYSLRIDSSNNVNFQIEDNSGTQLSVISDNILTMNTKYRIVGTYDSVNGSKIYINGIQTGTTSGSLLTINCGEQLKIGVAFNNFRFKGWIDEVRMYNRALSQAEITQLYQLTTPDILNTVRVTATDTPLGNQGTDTIHVGAFPAVSTTDATAVTSTSVQLNGSCTANLNTSTVWFEYGITSGEYIGSSTTVQVTGDTDTAVNISLGALAKNTEYVFRLRASNLVGETYGEEFSFITQLGYTLEEVTGLKKPLSWSHLGTTKFIKGLMNYGINVDQRWRSTKDNARLIANPDNEITLVIERN